MRFQPVFTSFECLFVAFRAAEMSDEVTRLRPPRFFQQDGLVRPYVRIEAEGSKLLQVCFWNFSR